jgi:VWFA-related protein
VLAAAALALIVTVPTVAQNPRFRSTVAVVRVDALVTEGRRTVSALTAANFEIRDNGVLQKVIDVQFETLPLNIICVLDVSASVEGKPLVHLKDAAAAVFGALAPGDRAALTTFSSRLQLHTRLTADRERLRAAVNTVTAGGSTALFDAVFAGLALREAEEGRTLLLLFSDGKDTMSWLTASQVVDAAKRSDVVIYPVLARETMPPGPFRIDPFAARPMRPSTGDKSAAEYVLGELADETGGRVVSADRESTLRETFLATLDEFRQRYVISYEPTGVAAASWHTIDVRLRGRSGQVKARRGYAESR